MLQSDFIKDSLEELHQLRFTLKRYPIDKANENVANICKRFHALIYTKELGLGKNHRSNPKTYEFFV